MTYRRRFNDSIWHRNPDCWNWPGGSYDARANLEPTDVICFECAERERNAAEIVPSVKKAGEIAAPLTRAGVLRRPFQ